MRIHVHTWFITTCVFLTLVSIQSAFIMCVSLSLSLLVHLSVYLSVPS